MNRDSLIAVLRDALAEARWPRGDRGTSDLDAEIRAEALAALDKIEQAAKDAHQLADDFVMKRAGPWNYEPHYKVRTALSEVLGRDA